MISWEEGKQVLKEGRMKGKSFCEIAICHSEYVNTIKTQRTKEGELLELYNWLVSIGRIVETKEIGV